MKKQMRTIKTMRRNSTVSRKEVRAAWKAVMAEREAAEAAEKKTRKSAK